MISAGDALLTVWTQSQMVTKSFLCLCMRDLSNEDAIAENPKEGKRRENNSRHRLMDGKKLTEMTEVLQEICVLAKSCDTSNRQSNIRIHWESFLCELQSNIYSNFSSVLVSTNS